MTRDDFVVLAVIALVLVVMIAGDLWLKRRSQK